MFNSFWKYRHFITRSIYKEHKELLPTLKYPPNVIDQFRLNSEIQAKAIQFHAELHAVYNSRSWQKTTPLRC